MNLTKKFAPCILIYWVGRIMYGGAPKLAIAAQNMQMKLTRILIAHAAILDKNSLSQTAARTSQAAIQKKLLTFGNMVQKVTKVLRVIAHRVGMPLRPEIMWISH